MEGLVTKNTGSWYIVRTENGDSIRCKIKGNFRLKGIRSTNPVSVGDLVDIELNPDQTAFITRIHERKNYIIRRSSNLSKESHIIAANIDYALLIVTVNTPPTSTTFIDRFLATAEAYRIPVCIVINKSDTFTEEDREYAEALRYLYTSIGYDCHCVSAITGEGFDFIDSFIANKITLLSGHSGVGKSTIIDRILPNAHVKIGAVSTSHHKGMHTTTFSEMYPLPQGGYIIDTPGIKGFGTIDFNPNEVAHFFPEIFEISQNCRFNNCTHRHEPGCAVLKALENHQISESRYTSYLSIIEDSSEENIGKHFKKIEANRRNEIQRHRNFIFHDGKYPTDKCGGKRLACTIEDRHRYYRYAFDKQQGFTTPTQHTRQQTNRLSRRICQKIHRDTLQARKQRPQSI